MARDLRIEFRVDAEEKARIELAAQRAMVPVGQFLRAAALGYAAQVGPVKAVTPFPEVPPPPQQSPEEKSVSERLKEMAAWKPSS